MLVRKTAARGRTPRSGVVLWPSRMASGLKAFSSARTKWRELRNGANNLAAVTRGSSAVVTAEEEAETFLRVFSSAMTLTMLWTRKSTETLSMSSADAARIAN